MYFSFLDGDTGTSSEETTNDIIVPGENEEIPRGRKRPRNFQKWKSNKRKLNRNSGKEYTSRSNRVTQAKVFPSGFDCKCPRKCREKFPSEDTLNCFFNSFWSLADYSKQNCFLRGLVKALAVSRRRIRDGSRDTKSKVYQYVIPDEHNLQVRVCKTYFLAMLQISWGRLYRCLTKTEVAAVIDARGKASSRKIDDSDVVEHIKSFPCYQSHYTRKDNDNKRYLNPDLTIKKCMIYTNRNVKVRIKIQ